MRLNSVRGASARRPRTRSDARDRCACVHRDETRDAHACRETGRVTEHAHAQSCTGAVAEAARVRVPRGVGSAGGDAADVTRRRVVRKRSASLTRVGDDGAGGARRAGRVRAGDAGRGRALQLCGEPRAPRQTDVNDVTDVTVAASSSRLNVLKSKINLIMFASKRLRQSQRNVTST